MNRFMKKIGFVGAALLVLGLAFAAMRPPAPGPVHYPSYNPKPLPADMSGMSDDAVSIARKMRLGWNVGNTMEAIGGETHWGNPPASNSLIRLVKQSGFNAIRLPVAWDQYADQKTGKISDAWLARVKQVVQYCVDNDMVVLVNIHWDGGWLQENFTAARQAAVNAKQKAYWEQIATLLRDFDGRVLFASANEPDVKDAAQMAILASYHQTFVDTVRATGGRNAYRVLVVQGPGTDIENTNKLMTAMPTDRVAGRLMAEVHYYSPYNFALMTKDEAWGRQAYYWGAAHHSPTDTAHNPTWGEEAFVDAMFGRMKAQFADKGIPVLLGEFGAVRRSQLKGDDLERHLAAHAYFHKYVVKAALKNGMIPFYWDTGDLGPNSFGLFDRKNDTVFDRRTIDAMREAAYGN
jgi:aryl-phospho-beta-D-glucosidase BglC (GH1 family)